MQLRRELSSKTRRGRRVAVDRRDDPYEGAVASSAADGIDGGPQLARVLAGDDPTVTLIPVPNHLTLRALFDHHFVDHDRAVATAARDLKLDPPALGRLPTAPWQAVQRRVDGIAFTLTAV